MSTTERSEIETCAKLHSRFCRVYRIGQSKETSFLRLVVKNTIDQAMEDIKERKNLEIDGVMNTAKLREQLSIKDLMQLFGDVGEDESGNPFIFAEEAEGDEHLRVPCGSGDEGNLMGDEA